MDRCHPFREGDTLLSLLLESGANANASTGVRVLDVLSECFGEVITNQLIDSYCVVGYALHLGQRVGYPVALCRAEWPAI